MESSCKLESMVCNILYGGTASSLFLGASIPAFDA